MADDKAHTSTYDLPTLDDVRSDTLKEGGGDKSMDSGVEISANKHYCSRAVTGSSPYFQEIYACQTCCSATDHGSESDVLPPCICSACADECHSDHDIVYIGLGPCFCDCNDFCCKIYDESVNAVKRLGFTDTDRTKPIQTSRTTINHLSNTKSTDVYVRDVYTIPDLNEKRFLKCLIRQSKELVQHSKDTFWLDANIVEQQKNDSLCELEKFAWTIFRRHMEHYGANEDIKQGDQEKALIVGAEWWVQVKMISPADEKTIAAAASSNHPNSTEAIDLHYDKDEEMASMFGIGVFPSLSTVTYLTEIENAPPTLIFSRRYDEVEDDNDPVGINDMFVSHPIIGKHVAFDGRLLHGAPSHPLLRRQIHQTGNARFPCDDVSNEKSIRITFLVNVWIGHKPIGVNELPVPIRSAIRASTIDDGQNAPRNTPTPFILNAPAVAINVQRQDDLPEHLRQRIELPFVGGKATWGGDDDDDSQAETDDNALIMSTYPPPLMPHSDTILVAFAADLAPMFKYEVE